MADAAAIAAAMQRMWTQFRPQMEQRVDVLETAAAALAEGQLSEEQRAAAAKAAHTLAGTLGTFGLAEGTALARESEPVFAADAPQDASRAARVAEIAATLRTMIEAKP
jgi:chemotaxis protein histidine kinase CheA